MCAVTGETISDDDNFLECVNGITISPKKSFCIIKIWMSSIKYQSTTKLNKIDGLSTYGCLFKNTSNTNNAIIIININDNSTSLFSLKP